MTGPVQRFARQIAGHGYIVAAPSSYHEFTGPEPLAYDVPGTDAGNNWKVEKVSTQLKLYLLLFSSVFSPPFFFLPYDLILKLSNPNTLFSFSLFLSLSLSSQDKLHTASYYICTALLQTNRAEPPRPLFVRALIYSLLLIIIVITEIGRLR